MGTNKQDVCKAIIAYAVAFRKAKGITTKEVAEAAGVKSQYVSRIESGKVDPALTSFINYADGIGCEIKLVSKDGSNDYRMLVEKLVKAFEKNDKERLAKVISDMRVKVYEDKRKEAAIAANSSDLFFNTEDIAIPVEQNKMENTNIKLDKRLKAYKNSMKGGNEK